MLVSFLYRNLKGFRRLVVVAILVTVIQVACDIATAFPLKFIISKVGNSGADPACTFPFLNGLESWFDSPRLDPSLRLSVVPPTTQCPVVPGDTSATIMLTSHSTIGVIVFSALLLIILGSASAILAWLDLFLAGYIAHNFSARLRNQLFDHLQRLSLDWHGKQKKGDLVQRVTGNIADVEKLLTDGLVDLLGGILTLVGVTVVMVSLNWQFTIVSLAIVPALFMIVITYTRNIKQATKRAASATGQVADVATEDINALTVIKVFTREEREALRFGAKVDLTRRAGLRARSLQAQFTPLVSILVVLGTATVVGVGGYISDGHAFSLGPFTIPAYAIEIGTLVVFLKFLGQLYQPMRDLSKLTTLMTSAASGAERIQEVLVQAPEVVETAVPYTGPTQLKGDIAFEDVAFGYVPTRPVLKGINLHIPAGRKIALVGLSGGGKTTLVKLIPRFYEIQQGAVKIDGVDNRLYPLGVLRQNVSMVLQDSVLFEGTIRENIALGKPGAVESEIIAAAQQANIHDVIENELGGYDRLVREQGKDLSGGQRQRVAIARAMLRDAPILILDEPTAALDVEAEAEVMHALEKLIVGRTVIMISHRLSTLGHVDEIVVLKDGQIAERGSFSELRRTGGVFAGLLAEQNRYSGEKVAEQTMVRSAFRPLADAFVEAVPAHASPGVGAGSERNAPLSAPVRRSGPLGYPGDHATRPAQPIVSPAPGLDVTMPRRGRIVVEVDGTVVGERQLNKPLLSVGRRSGNDIHVPSDHVSRLHARVRWDQGVWVIEDAESLNGLLYQGQRVDQRALSDGDSIYLAPQAVLHYKAS